MSYAVVFAPEAEDQLADLYLYIANEASPIFLIAEHREMTFGPDCVLRTTKVTR